ncbi:MAG: glycosyltransferase family 2 protein [Candidatus Magasanikbacteria bacterium]|nr:glycosyltransferase family 2 protein [Candidatus Magasanikbacteria bacterium]
MKDINIVLVNYRSRADILQAVESIMKDIAAEPYAVQVTVVDNSNNTDNLKEQLDINFPRVKYLNTGENVGFGRGNVIGFKATPARYYFALNRDTIIPENSQTIARLVKFMDEHPKIGCVGPKLVNLDGTLQYACYRFDRPSLLIKPLKQIRWDEKYRWARRRTERLLMSDFDHNETRPVDWVLGAAMVVRREVAETIGWFDERFFMYLEDCDWCRRMWDSGWPVYYVHDIIIKHRYDRGSAKIPGLFKALFKNKLARIHLISWLKYMWKWRGTHKYF